MKAIVVGGGQLGRSLATRLAGDGIDVNILERDGSKAGSLAETSGVVVCCGDGRRMNDLENAGARGADMLFAVTDSDECNLLTAVLARDALGIARVFASVNHSDNGSVFDALKVPHVEPCLIGAKAIYHLAAD